MLRSCEPRPYHFPPSARWPRTATPSLAPLTIGFATIPPSITVEFCFARATGSPGIFIQVVFVNLTSVGILWLAWPLAAAYHSIRLLSLVRLHQIST